MLSVRAISSLILPALTALSLVACNADTVEDDPEGRSCEIANEAVVCGDTELLSYCSFENITDAEYNQPHNLLQGPCVDPEDNVCEPGDYRHEPSTNPEDGDLCGGTDYHCQVVAGEAMWVAEPCDTPLVLRFDDAPIEMIAAESTPSATFDISMRADSCITTDWPTAATPWLVVDRDQNGSIDGGHELFGSGTRLASGTHAAHGFAALAEFDGNHDGRVDARDPGFASLMLWRDHDADRRSSPDELEGLAAAGVEGLSVDFAVRSECDDRGNCGVQRAGFEFAGGVGEIVDLYLSCH